jgi:catechol 2,3-dioxygenase-like lactoylglutathione lyase family enzyme
MLGDKDMRPVIAVRDLDEAKQFYTKTLGLQLQNEDKDTETATLKSGNSDVLLYVSDYAGSNQATVGLWIVDDIAPIVEKLEDQGVSFEEYQDVEGVIIKSHVHVFEATEAAWFKDPDGNILCVSNGM